MCDVMSWPDEHPKHPNTPTEEEKAMGFLGASDKHTSGWGRVALSGVQGVFPQVEPLDTMDFGSHLGVRPCSLVRGIL